MEKKVAVRARRHGESVECRDNLLAQIQQSRHEFNLYMVTLTLGRRVC